MRDLMTAFNAAIIVLLAFSSYGESAATSVGPPSSGSPSQLVGSTALLASNNSVLTKLSAYVGKLTMPNLSWFTPSSIRDCAL